MERHMDVDTSPVHSPEIAFFKMVSAYATFYPQLKETISPTTMGVSDRGCVCASTSGLARDSGFCGSIVIYEYA